MTGWLPGYAAVVTGAGSGIGAAVVRRYLAEGAAGVVAVDRDAGRLAELAAEAPGHVVPVAGDVRDAATHQAATDACLERFGRLDVLVANAGVFDFNRPLVSYDPGSLASAMDELFAINLRGYMLAAMAARAALAEARGSIICTASIAGLHAGCGGTLYTVVKHAVVGFIRQLAHEWAPEIRVNGVGPGGTLTDLRGTRALGHGERSIRARYLESQARIAEAVPLKLAQRPEDHTGLYVLLASRDNARAITGEILMSDGGIGVRGA